MVDPLQGLDSRWFGRSRMDLMEISIWGMLPVGFAELTPIRGRISTVAGTGVQGYTGDGGPATAARIGSPSALRFDAKGNLYFSDLTQHVVRRVDTKGIITTVVGCGEAGFSPDGTPVLEARLHKPLGLAVTGDGRVYFSDSRNNRVRRVASDGTLQTVAGSDTPGRRREWKSRHRSQPERAAWTLFLRGRYTADL